MAAVVVEVSWRVEAMAIPDEVGRASAVMVIVVKHIFEILVLCILIVR